MTGNALPGRVAMLLWLLLVWTLLWGSASPPVLVGGVAAAAVTYWAARLPAPPTLGRVRPTAVPVVVWEFLSDLVVSSLTIAWFAVRRPRDATGAVIEVPVRAESDVLLFLITESLSLRPGSMVVGLDRERAVVHVHCFPVRGPAEADRLRRDVMRSERRLIRAFGTRRDLAALHRDEHGDGHTDAAEEST